MKKQSNIDFFFDRISYGVPLKIIPGKKLKNNFLVKKSNFVFFENFNKIVENEPGQ